MKNTRGGQASSKSERAKFKPAQQTMKASAAPRLGQGSRSPLDRWKLAQRSMYPQAEMGYRKFRQSGRVSDGY